MKVALAIHHVRPAGGQDRYALELARRLASRCDLDLVTISASGELPSTVRVRTVRVPSRPFLLAAPLFRWAAARTLRSGRYDLVHGTGGATPGASVVTAHFCAAEWRRTDRTASAYQRLVSAQAVRDERRAYGHPALRAVIAVSKRTADDVARHYGPLRAPTFVIPNGVDQTRFAPSGRPRAPGRTRLLFVGAYGRKGLDTAIRALALMTRDAELVAVGDGDRARFLALAAALGVADRVRLEPWRERIEEAYTAADVFVFPTRYEPFGMVIAEALASGLPVVTSAAAGAAELVRGGVAGSVVADPEDAAAFAAALDRLAGDEALLAAMGRAARECVRGLTWDDVAARTWEVYESVVAEARS